MFVACLGPQQTLKYVTVSQLVIFILYISKMRICTKLYASILSLICLIQLVRFNDSLLLL